MTLSIPGLSYRHIVGPVLQSCALTASSGDYSPSSSSSLTDLSCDTRAVNLVVLFILLLLSTIISAAAPYTFLCLLLPIVHVDLLFHLVTRLLHSILWARRLSPSELFYLDEIFPLQVAATIWNDCRPVSSSPSHLVFTTWIGAHVALWTPVYARRHELFTRLPVYVLLRGLTIILARVERTMFFIWHVLFHDGVTNRFPMSIEGNHPHVVGHAMLLSERQLTWLQRFAAALLRDDRAATMRSDTVLRVGVQAVHCANLLNMPGHTRLMENAPGGIAMNELYAGVTTAGARADEEEEEEEAIEAEGGGRRRREDDVDGEGVKTLLSMYNELDILHDLPNGNRTKRGCAAPRQVVWARLVVGAAQAVHARSRPQPQLQQAAATRHHRWRCAIAMAQFTVAQGNVTAAQTRPQQQPGGPPPAAGSGRGIGTASRTAIQRHVYSVLRRWLVDWVGHVWFHAPLLTSFTDPVNVDLLFNQVRTILYANTAGNTRSVAHAVGELAGSTNRTADINAMLGCVLGSEWQEWWETCRVGENERLREVVEMSGQWKCSGRQVEVDDCVDARLYGSLPLEEAVVVREEEEEETRARAVIVARVANVLVERVRRAWDNLPDDVTGLGGGENEGE